MNLTAEEVRTIFREEFRFALGLDELDADKMAMLPLKERQKIMKAHMAEAKAAMKKGGK